MNASTQKMSKNSLVAINEKPTIFLSMPNRRLREQLIEILVNVGFSPIWSETFGGSQKGNLSEHISTTDFLIADVSDGNPTVFLEIGVAMSLDKKIILLVQDSDIQNLPSYLQGSNHILVYDHLLQENLISILNKFLEVRQKQLQDSIFDLTPSFFVDWSKLESRDIENLVNELLIQMGFLNVEWIKEKSGIELIAELPKRDPDGFDYKDVWLVSFAHRHLPEMMLMDLREDPGYFIHRLFRNKRLFEREKLLSSSNASITLLFVLIGESHQKSLFDFNELQEYSFRNRGMNLRVRIWDESYLTSLVYKYSHLGIKYFSDESRSLSKYRKTPEELNRENVRLLEAERKLTKELEDVNNKIVRLERDAIWKDISFTAAHKIGNPIFAIETNLEPLQKRINEQKADEAIQIVGRIRNSVEKAKGIVDQFKSLAKAQNIHPVSTFLYPFFEDVCREVKSRGVSCEINCPKDLEVAVDPERLSECFDELALNATRFFKKDQKKKIIHIEAIECIDDLPFLDSTKKYILIHFRDNGTGISIENKDKIFNALFTTRIQGAGLGLALVRTIIEGHGGAIREVGSPKKGADFEIYLPLSEKNINIKQSKGVIQNGKNINS